MHTLSLAISEGSVMTRTTVLTAACFAAVLPGVGRVAAAATASPLGLSAQLTPGQEVPRQVFRVSNAAGKFSATLKPSSKGYHMYWRLTCIRWSGSATTAYIHQGRRGLHGAAFVHLCSRCLSGAHGNRYFSPYELRLARQGRLYVNVRTAKNPAGEIRGQIVVR
jgi:CHRD domain